MKSVRTQTRASVAALSLLGAGVLSLSAWGQGSMPRRVAISAMAAPVRTPVLDSGIIDGNHPLLFNNPGNIAGATLVGVAPSQTIRAFVWTPPASSHQQVLFPGTGFSFVYALNNATPPGMLVAVSRGGGTGFRGVFWNGSDTVRDLTPAGYVSSQPNALNDLGDAVGTVRDRNGVISGMRFNHDGTATPLPGLNPGDVPVPVAVNNFQEAAGYITPPPGGVAEGVFWDADGTPHALGHVSQAGNEHVNPQVINNARPAQVAGFLATPTGHDVFTWTAAHGIHQLTPAGFIGSQLAGLNDKGQVSFDAAVNADVLFTHVWQDANGDGAPQPSEYEVLKLKRSKYSFSAGINNAGQVIFDTEEVIDNKGHTIGHTLIWQNGKYKPAPIRIPQARNVIQYALGINDPGAMLVAAVLPGGTEAFLVNYKAPK